MEANDKDALDAGNNSENNKHNEYDSSQKINNIDKINLSTTNLDVSIHIFFLNYFILFMSDLTK